MSTRVRKPADLHKEDLTWMEKNKVLTRPDYIELEGSMIVGVYCKRCGRKIQGLMNSGRKPRILKGPRNTRIEQHYVALGPLPPYTSVEIECDDGSKHESPCCKECAVKLTASELDAFLIADTEAEIKTEKVAGRGLSERMLEHRVMRRVKRSDT